MHYKNAPSTFVYLSEHGRYPASGLKGSSSGKAYNAKKRMPKPTALCNPYNFTPRTFTFTVSTIIPVKTSTLYLMASFNDSATALMDTPYFIMTYTST